MKKLLLCLLLICITFSLQAIPSFKDANSWIPSSLKIGTGNDKWTFSLSRNDDDRLSFSGDISISAPRWFLTTHLNGYTNRGWKTDWDPTAFNPEHETDSDSSHFYHGRYDGIDTAFGMNFFPLETEHLTLTFSPFIGFYGAGDFGFDNAQNWIHKISNIHSVNIAYDAMNSNNDSRLFAFKLGANIEFNAQRPLGNYLESDVGVSIGFTSDNNIGFETLQSLYSSLYLSKNNNKLLKISFGYNWYNSFDSSATHRLVLDFQRGMFFGFDVTAGFLNIAYKNSIETVQGYTILSVDALSFFEKPCWEENSILFSYGIARENKSTLHFASLGYNLIDNKDISIFTTLKYEAGNPFDKKDEREGDDQQDRLKQNISSISFGIKYNFLDRLFTSFITPYVGLSMGVQNWTLDVLTNQNSTNDVPSYTFLKKYTFLLSAELGLYLLPEGLWSVKNTNIRLALAGGVTWIPDANALREVFDLFELPFPKTNFMPYATIALQFGYDF